MSDDKRKAFIEKMRADLVLTMGGYEAIHELVENFINNPPTPGPDALRFEWKPL